MGPNLCSATAVPRTIGTSGRTQGDKIERTPAASASAMLAKSIGIPSERFSEDRLDHLGTRFARRAQRFGLAAIDDQRGELMRVDLGQFASVRIVVGVEDRQVAERGILQELFDDLLLELARPAPFGGDLKDKNLPRLLRLRKSSRVERGSIR